MVNQIITHEQLCKYLLLVSTTKMLYTSMYFLIIESDNSKSDTYPQAICDLNVYLTNISFLCMIHITYFWGMSKMYNISRSDLRNLSLHGIFFEAKNIKMSFICLVNIWFIGQMQLSMHLFMFVLIEHKDIKFQTCETVV